MGSTFLHRAHTLQGFDNASSLGHRTVIWIMRVQLYSLQTTSLARCRHSHVLALQQLLRQRMVAPFSVRFEGHVSGPPNVRFFPSGCWREIAPSAHILSYSFLTTLAAVFARCGLADRLPWPRPAQVSPGEPRPAEASAYQFKPVRTSPGPC